MSRPRGGVRSSIPVGHDHPVMAFWVASPTMDPEIFALTVGVLGWPLAVARLLAALLLSLGAGYLTLLVTRNGLLGKMLRQNVAGGEHETERTGDCCAQERAPARPEFVGVGAVPGAGMPVAPAVAGSAEAGCAPGCGAEPQRPRSEARWYATAVAGLRELSWKGFGHDVTKEGWRLGRWLLVAFVMEALILAYVPQEAIAGTLGGSNSFALPLAALIGAPLYLTEAAALPIVSGLLESGMSPGAAIAFLLAGPATTVPAMVAVWALVRPRVFALYLSVAVVGAAVLGLLTDAVL